MMSGRTTCDGIHRRRASKGTFAPPAGSEIRRTDLRCTRRCTQERRHAPRPEAREYSGHEDRNKAARLRTCQNRTRRQSSERRHAHHGAYWQERDRRHDVSTPPSSTGRRQLLPWIVVAVLAVLATIASWIAYRSTRRAELKPLVRLEGDLGHDVYLNALGGTDIILSSDGTRIAYLSRNHLYTRKPDQTASTPLPLTTGATRPVFSPPG